MRIVQRTYLDRYDAAKSRCSFALILRPIFRENMSGTNNLINGGTGLEIEATLIPLKSTVKCSHTERNSIWFTFLIRFH